MNPWSIIGWGIVGVGCCIALALIHAWLLIVVRPAIRRRRRHWATRDIAPAAGQTWRQDDSNLTVDRIADNGRIVIKSRNASWSDSPDEWRDRVRNRRLWLVQR